ncbi:MAG: hypothetical protein HYX42_21820 [Polaromonas sp.]|uniref:hypothetical protein n=1 Tax=Polaromonas sp. TaxID=1869339 RepID=UPI0025FAC5FA|nr:hypothetical protein [Polaromonas sp.]MBI2728888.1 hypothetical protein [Polaromonas sp.]
MQTMQTAPLFIIVPVFSQGPGICEVLEEDQAVQGFLKAGTTNPRVGMAGLIRLPLRAR